MFWLFILLVQVNRFTLNIFRGVKFEQGVYLYIFIIFLQYQGCFELHKNLIDCFKDID
jgi:hypothetical protein